MSSIGSILNDAASGVQTAQTALQVVSNNVSNVNTPGYVQTEVNQASLVAGAQGTGVTVADVQRVTNQYLEATNYTATAASSSASSIASSMDQAQDLFGDPSATGSLFANLDSVFSAFSSLSANPSSAASASAVATTNEFFNQANSISTSLQGLSTQADQQISSDVTTANQLLTQISQLNSVISQNAVSTQDVTGAQNQQSQLITQLSSMMNIKVSPTALGGVNILSTNGATLVGTYGASTIAYNPTASSGDFSLTNAAGLTSSFNGAITSGEIGGLVQLRNSELPSLSSQLAALTAGAATELNAVHNDYSAVPPPTTMTGQNTGVDLSTAVGDFSGKTTIALVNPTTDALDHSIAIDFTADTITVDGGAATGFSASNFLSTLNSAMASTGATATYTNGVLSLASNSSDGIAIQDDATTPATDGGQGFSQFFGLNNLVSSGSITNYNTGLKATDASGYPSGQTLTLQVNDPSGNKINDVTITTPTGGTVADLMTALNATTGGVGAYGSFSLSSTGALTFNPTTAGDSLSVVADGTANTAAGASISQLFGIGASTRNAAASTYAVRSDILANPALLATASLNLSATTGDAVLASGDSSGADALGQAGTNTLDFPAVSGVAAQSSTLSNYAASISAVIANTASAADNAKTNAATLATNATSALSSVEGVSIDQEMINLTTYQQAYNASARMIQAANDLFTTLLGMVGT